MAGFPVENLRLDIQERLIREGEFFPMYGRDPNILWTGQQESGGMPATALTPGIPFTKGYYMTSVNISSSKDIMGQFIWGYYVGLGNYPVTGQTFLAGPNGTTIPMNVMVRNRMSLPKISVLDFPEANIQSVLPISTTTGVLVRVANGASVSSQRYSNLVTATNTTGSSIINTVVTHKLPKYYKYISASGAGWAFSLDDTTQILTATFTGTITAAGTSTYTVIGAPKETLNLVVTVSGYLVDDDINYNARPMYVYGTSISFGTGITQKIDSYLYKLRSWLRDTRGTDVRVVNRAISGTSTVQQEDMRANENRYDFTENPKLFIIEEGINDVSQSVSNSISVANITAAVNHVRRKSPTTKIFILGAFPTANSTTEANLVTFRTAVQNYYNALTTGEKEFIYYVASTSTLWNAATQSGTYTTDGIHLNAAGNQLLATAITDFITANNIIL